MSDFKASMVACAGLSLALASAASGQVAPDRQAGARPQGRDLAPQPVQIEDMRHLHVTTSGRVLESPDPGIAGDDGCSDQRTHTDASFDGGEYFAQAGFAEGEVAAATYELDPSDFPIRIDTTEMVFATVSATEQTTTHWSVLVWDGEPDDGALVAEFSSDGKILPHLVAGPGTTGTNIQISVDPDDPNQIFVFNDTGTNKFTIGYRIDQHNAPSANPCVTPPPENRNAFPVTDTGPLNAPEGNWLEALNCGSFGCPPGGGWTDFAGLSSLCRPSGDWVIRASWTEVDCQPGVGACCKPDGACETMLVEDCNAIGGTYQGDGSECDDAGIDCPEPVGACCNPGGGCLGEVTEGDCNDFGGQWAGPGTDCIDTDGDGVADDCADPCPPDLTGGPDGQPDGMVTSEDFLEFIDLFAAGDPEADFGGGPDGEPDGEVTSADFLAYIDLFAAGCP